MNNQAQHRAFNRLRQSHSADVARSKGNNVPNFSEWKSESRAATETLQDRMIIEMKGAKSSDKLSFKVIADTQIVYCRDSRLLLKPLIKVSLKSLRLPCTT